MILFNKSILAIIYVIFIFYSIKMKCFYSGKYEMGYIIFFIYCAGMTLFLNIPLILKMNGLYKKASCLAIWLFVLYIAILITNMNCNIIYKIKSIIF